jgi:hypothetical protein
MSPRYEGKPSRWPTLVGEGGDDGMRSEPNWARRLRPGERVTSAMRRAWCRTNRSSISCPASRRGRSGGSGVRGPRSSASLAGRRGRPSVSSCGRALRWRLAPPCRRQAGHDIILTPLAGRRSRSPGRRAPVNVIVDYPCRVTRDQRSRRDISSYDATCGNDRAFADCDACKYGRSASNPDSVLNNDRL